MQGNFYYGAAQPPTPKWYNPNRFNAADAALAYLFSAVGLLAVQYYVTIYFSVLEEYADFALDVVFTILSQGLMLGIALLMGKRKKVNVIRGGGMYLDTTNSHLGLVFLCFFISMTIFFPLTDVIEGLFFTPEELGSMRLEGEGPLFYVFYVLAIVGPAFGEEFLFRGVITNGLREYGKVKAVLLSSLMFSLMHTNPLQTIYQFMLGIFFGMLYVETNNLLPSMILHGLNNALSGLGSFVYRITNPTWTIVYYAVTVTLGVLALVWLIYATLKKSNKQNGWVRALYPVRNEWAEEMHKAQGRYYAAVKTAVAEGFQDEIVDFRAEHALKEERQGKWFFMERIGWKPFNKKSKKSKVALWLSIAFAVNVAIWVLILAVLKGWITL